MMMHGREIWLTHQNADALVHLKMCLGSDRTDGQTVHPRAELLRVYNLIPVSGVGEAVGGVSEVVGDEKIRGNGVEGTFD